jgi:8-oxo-dGTP diphosphatase
LSEDPYKDKLRVRVSGILIRDDKLLLVKLNSPARDNPVWMPPGGGVEHGELLDSALRREFKEETGLHIEVKRIVMVHEFIEHPFHALELYFLCFMMGGDLRTGRDPEHAVDEQILLNVQFFALNELKNIELYPEALIDLIPRLSDQKNKTGIVHIRSAGTSEK